MTRIKIIFEFNDAEKAIASLSHTKATLSSIDQTYDDTDIKINLQDMLKFTIRREREQRH